MKNYILFFLIMSFALNLKAQTPIDVSYTNSLEYKYLYSLDKFKSDGDCSGLVWYSTQCINNGSKGLNDNHLVMESLINMYESTKEVFYLQVLANHIENILMRRDDNNPYTNSGSNTATWAQVPEKPAMEWCGSKIDTGRYCREGNYANNAVVAWIYDSGIFTYPMAYLCYVVKRDHLTFNLLPYFGYSIQNNLNLPWDRNLGIDVFVNSFLIKEIEKTVKYHDFEWDDNEGLYKMAQNTFKCEGVNGACFYGSYYPINMQHAMGRTLLMMYELYNTFGVSGGFSTNYYLTKLNGLYKNFRNEIDSFQTQENFNHYPIWRYFHKPAIIKFKGCNDDMLYNQEIRNAEDVNHADLTFHFIYLLRKFNLFSTSSSFPLDDNFMLDLVNTFKDGVLEYPRCYNFNVYGQNQSVSNTKEKAGFRWLYLSEYSDDIYSLFSDEFLHPMLNDFPSSAQMLGISIGNYFLRYADNGLSSPIAGQSPNKYFNPISFEDFHSTYSYASPCFTVSSNWSDVDAGDIDSDGIKEIVTVNKNNGNYELYRVNPDTNFAINLPKTEYVSSWVNLSSPNNWQITLAKVLINGNLETKLVVCRDNDPSIYIYKFVNSQFVSDGQITLSSLSGKWGGIDAGNLDGSLDGQEEVALVDESRGDLYVLKWNGSSFQLAASFNNAGSNALYFDLECGNVDVNNNSKDEIVVGRNADGQIIIYEFILNTTNPYSSSISGLSSSSFYNFQNSSMAFKKIAIGNFNQSDSKQEIAVSAASDGEIYFLSTKPNNALQRDFEEESFGYVSLSPYNFDGLIDAIEVGAAYNKNLNSCPSNIINLRNYDNSAHIYEVNYEGVYCARREKYEMNICEHRRPSQIDSNSDERNKELSLSIDIIKDEVVEILILNQLGSIIMKLNPKEQNLAVEIQKLPKGLYFISSFKKNSVETKKIVNF